MTDFIGKYRQWLHDMDVAVRQAQPALTPAIRPALTLLDTVAAYLKAGRELTAYETQLFIETFFHQQQQTDPPSIWPETLWQSLAQVTDKTQVEWQELQQDLLHQGLYSQGEWVGMGVYVCVHCGEASHYNHAAELLVCPQCQGGRFVRRGLPL